MPIKKGVLDLHEMEHAGEKIAWLTAHDCPTTTFEEAAALTDHVADVRASANPVEAHFHHMLDGGHETFAAYMQEDR